MNILILSCGTGGGHNAAAYAVEEEAKRRGWNVTLMNPYGLCAQGVAQRVDSAYISIAQASPRGFGAIYAIGNAYRRLPWRSPVYFACPRPFLWPRTTPAFPLPRNAPWMPMLSPRRC